MRDQNTKEACCDKNNFKKGFLGGLFYGLIPHFGCLMYILFTVLGVTALSSVFKPLLFNRYFFYLLIAFSLALVSVSAIIYLKRNDSLSIAGTKRKWKYLLTLYGATVFINLFLFLVVFPWVANFNVDTFLQGASLGIVQNADSKLILEIDIPCSGHAPLVIEELKKIDGIREVKYRLPNFFDVYYDSGKISEKTIMSLEIFKNFKAQVKISLKGRKN